MSLFHSFYLVIVNIVQKLGEVKSVEVQQDLLRRIVVESPKEVTHGDIATNAAMIACKAFNVSPQVLAKFIIEALILHPDIEHAEVAGPGFINLKLKKKRMFQELLLLLKQGEAYGNSKIGAGEKIIVEILSANPTGPLHAGHGRNAILGDAIASLLHKVGFDVNREYFINDAGGQILALARSVYLRYREALGYAIEENAFDGDLYPGDYLIPLGCDLAQKFGTKFIDQSESLWIEIFSIYAVQAMMKGIQKDLELLGVHINTFVSEKELADQGVVTQTLEFLNSHGDIYVGKLDQPKGHQVDDWEEREQTLFKATKYGDDIDRVIKKSDGNWTYFAGDIAYHFHKWQRGYKNIVDVFGADHSGYVKRLKAAVRAITGGQANFEIKVCQMVNFMDQGVPVRMSKRSGHFISVSDVIDRVGKDATRFLMVSRHNDITLDFDFTKVVEQSRDNPIFYIQYAHARIYSVIRHGKNFFPDIMQNLHKTHREHLTDEMEWQIIKILADWPRQIELAALTREPHRIGTYLYNLSSSFHGLWNKGKENLELRFIDTNNQERTIAKLSLLQGVAYVIADGLKLLGIQAIEEMRA